MKKTIVTIASIRPDLPRLAATISELDNSEYNHIFISSGQHYDHNRFDMFLDELGIRQPDIRLSSGAPGRDGWEQISICGTQLVAALNDIKPRPSLVLYLGDSNSAMSAVAVKRAGYKVARIEALMRAYPSAQDMQYESGSFLPEELNRRIADSVSDILLTYTHTYVLHGMREGIPKERIYVIGNTIVEAVSKFADHEYIGKKSHILADIHRHSNIESKSRLEKIILSLNDYSAVYGTKVIMLDFGRTTDAINKFNINLGKIKLIPLMGYKDFLRAQQDSLFVVSDSGTSCEETPLLKVPVICPREEDERPEAFYPENQCAFKLHLDEPGSFQKSINWLNSYDPQNTNTEWLGTGQTSKMILDVLRKTEAKFW